jgi:hypothetical protein
LALHSPALAHSVHDLRSVQVRATAFWRRCSRAWGAARGCGAALVCQHIIVVISGLLFVVCQLHCLWTLCSLLCVCFVLAENAIAHKVPHSARNFACRDNAPPASAAPPPPAESGGVAQTALVRAHSHLFACSPTVLFACCGAEH